jgi:hypothetical protein
MSHIKAFPTEDTQDPRGNLTALTDACTTNHQQSSSNGVVSNSKTISSQSTAASQGSPPSTRRPPAQMSGSPH